MTNQIEIQRIARLSDMNRQRLAQIEDQVVRLNNVKEEHVHVHTSLQNIQTTPQSSLVPIGAGIHLPIKFRDQQKTHINQTYALEPNCISSYKNYSLSFFYKKS